MRLFVARPRPGPLATGAELPAGLAAVGEALVSAPGTDALEACAAAGAGLARDGTSLEEAFDALHATWRAVRRRTPSYAALRALGAAWSEETLGHLHRLGCDDPLTGLTSRAHLRSRLAELYRDQAAGTGRVAADHALLVLDSPGAPPDDGVGAALRTARLGETVRTVFAGGHTVARLSTERVAAVVPRDHRLDRRVDLVGALVARIEPWVEVRLETLPGSDDAVGRLLAVLARP